MMQTRSNIEAARNVEEAIASLHLVGTQRAARFLHGLNVPQEVAERVLLHPEQRRKYTFQFNSGV